MYNDEHIFKSTWSIENTVYHCSSSQKARDKTFYNTLNFKGTVRPDRICMRVVSFIMVCMCSSRDLFCQTVLHKCGRDINCSLDCSSQVKKFHHSATQTKIELHFGGFFHQSAPANRKTGFYANREPNKQEVGFMLHAKMNPTSCLFGSRFA